MRLAFAYISGLVFVVGFVAGGCDQKVQVRTYREVFSESARASASDTQDPHAFLGAMPDDDVHAGLRSGGASPGMMGALPDDDIHAGLRSGASSGMMGALPAGMGMAASAAPPLAWDTPEGWVEQKGSDMRLATFVSAGGGTAFETSIVSLPGSAGGHAANVRRWMGQLKMEAPTDAELETFLSRQESFQTSSGLPVFLVNFTSLQSSAAPQTPSMAAAIIEAPGAQVFVKMMGEKDAVIKNLEALKSLVQSIRVRPSP